MYNTILAFINILKAPRFGQKTVSKFAPNIVKQLIEFSNFKEGDW
jgi:hypothetical protein